MSELTNALALTRKLELAQSAAEAAEKAPSRSDHASSMLNLDRDKFSLAKGINELETTVHSLEATCISLREELQTLQSQDSEEDSKTDDPTLFG